MNDNEIVNHLNSLAQYARSFGYDELLDLADPSIDHERLRNTITADVRFVHFTDRACGEEHFVPAETLYRWFSELSVRLAEAGQARLSEHRLAALMSSLRLNGRWDVPPAEAIDFGRRFGFVGPAWTAGQYVFPVAHILSFVSSSLARRSAIAVPQGSVGISPQPQTLEQQLQKSVQDGFSKFSDRAVRIIRAREGLSTNKKATLEQIGNQLGLTRERVRQLEAKFWLCVPRRALGIRPFLVALLCDVMARQGSLVVSRSSPDAPLRRFLAKCAGVPQAEVPHCGLVVLGSSLKEVVAPESPQWSPDDIDPNTLAACLESNQQLCLIESDLKLLSEKVTRHRQRRLSKAQRVCIALRKVGRLAHYSRVTEVYNLLFPDCPSNEHNIHAVLSREEHGVVWIGIKGTFALEEWGYEHPPITLFDAVTEIVQNRFRQTGKPVPFEVVCTEIEKYRQVVRPSSLAFATYCNPSLQRVHGDSFVPKTGDRADAKFSDEELDRALQEFERQRKRQDNEMKHD